jgi:ribosomal protein L29
MTDFKNTTEKDLMKSIAEKRKLLQTFRFGSSGSKTRNVKEGLNLRKDIARMLTELSSRKTNKA